MLHENKGEEKGRKEGKEKKGEGRGKKRLIFRNSDVVKSANC